MKIRFLLTALLLPVFLLSDQLSKADPSPVCGFPHIVAKPADVQVIRLLQKPAAGDTSFYIWNNMNADDAKMIEVTFRKLRETENIIVYAEVAEIEANRANVTAADKLINALLYETPASSVNPNKGILANELDLFGQLPDVAGNGKLIVLLIDVRDDYEAGTKDTYVAGYFDPRDQIALTGKSNYGDIIYIDTNPGKIYDDYTLGVVAHELQHLIHYGIDQDESLWLNEGFSEFATFILGFDYRSYSIFLRDTNRPLTGFDNSLTDYAKVGLWTFYNYKQFGLEYLKDVVNERSNSLESYSRVLTKHGFTLSIEEVMRNWFVANLINNPDIHSGIYSYKGFQLSDIYSDHFYGSFQDEKTVDGVIKNSAAQYIQFYAGKDIRFNFDYSEGAQFFMAIVKQGEAETVEFATLGGSNYNYNDPQFGIDYTKITFIPYWTRISGSELSKSFRYSAQLIGGVEETEILYDDELAYYIYLNHLEAAEKFTAPENGNYQLAGVKFQVGHGATVNVSVFLSQIEPAVATYEIVPSEGEMTNFYLPTVIPIPEPGDVYIVIGSDDSSQSVGYSETGNGLGRAFLKNGLSFSNLSNYKVDESSLSGDWIIGAILHENIIIAPEIDVSPPVLYLWNGEYSKQFEIRNLGSGEINWQIVSPVADWIGLSPVSGLALASLQKVIVTARRNLLDPGIYNQLISIESTGGSDSLWISILERNLYAPQSAIFNLDMSFSKDEQKKVMRVLNIGSSDAGFSFQSDNPALVFYPEYGELAISDTASVTVLIDSDNIQSTRIPFSFFNGIDTLDLAFTYAGIIEEPKEAMTLFPVIPNPYIASVGNPAQIRYRLEDDSGASLHIYNIRGETIQSIRLNRPSAGLHMYPWDGKNLSGHHVSSGVYFLVLQQSGKVAKRKMLLLN